MEGEESRRKSRCYHKWCKPAEGHAWPQYLRGLPTRQEHEQRKALARFRLGNHTLQVELGRRSEPQVPWAQRTCTRCSPQHLQGLECKVDDEHHAVFECSAFQRHRTEVQGAQELIAQAGGCLRTFLAGDVGVVSRFVSACVADLDALQGQEQGIT